MKIVGTRNHVIAPEPGIYKMGRTHEGLLWIEKVEEPKSDIPIRAINTDKGKWMHIGTGGREAMFGSCGPPLVSDLPIDPHDGDQIRLIVDEANKIVWYMIFVASSSYNDLPQIGPQLRATRSSSELDSNDTADRLRLCPVCEGSPSWWAECPRCADKSSRKLDSRCKSVHYSDAPGVSCLVRCQLPSGHDNNHYAIIITLQGDKMIVWMQYVESVRAVGGIQP